MVSTEPSALFQITNNNVHCPDEIKYFAELHSNINSITLSVYMPPNGAKFSLQPEAIDLVPNAVLASTATNIAPNIAPPSLAKDAKDVTTTTALNHHHHPDTNNSTPERAQLQNTVAQQQQQQQAIAATPPTTATTGITTATATIAPSSSSSLPPQEPQPATLIPQQQQHQSTPAATTRSLPSFIKTRIVLPARINPAKTSKVGPPIAIPKDGTSLLTLKLTVVPSTTTTPRGETIQIRNNELPEPPLPASDLQGLQNLSCLKCGTHLLVLLKSDDQEQKKQKGQAQGPLVRIVDLPSEHWQELVDCWMCHEEDFSELREGDLGARQGQGLIGGIYILIHALDVEQSKIQVQEGAKVVDWGRGTKRKWQPLCCSNCEAPVGDGWYQVKHDSQTDIELLQVKFHKYSVGYVFSTKNEIQRRPFTQYLAAEMFESVKHHATYRFLIQDRLNAKEIALMWMLNWDSAIVTNRLQLNSGDHLSSLNDGYFSGKVVKVLYMLPPASSTNTEKTNQSKNEPNKNDDQDTKDQKDTEVWARWRADPNVERIELGGQLGRELQQLLKRSTECLPPAQGGASAVMGMDGMQVGWFAL